MITPKHQDPTYPDRIARAPYNFVPLPTNAVPTSDPLLPQDRYYSAKDGRHTGRIDCTLTTCSPLYTRGAVALVNYGQQAAKDLPGFFVNPATREPTIPGSSLRGMFRTLIETMCGAKMGSVTRRNLFFRTMDDSNVGAHYGERMGSDRLRGGILRMVDESYWIEPCIVGRVQRDQLVEVFHLPGWLDLYDYNERARDPEKDPNMKPSWLYQHRRIWVELQRTAGQELGHFLPILAVSADPNQEARSEATLVLTGNMRDKQREFVMVRTNVPRIDIDEEVIRRFHDDDQLTQWQERAFPRNRPEGGYRRKDGALRDGEPVFYLLDDLGEVFFLGRAAHFRLPYSRSPYDMVNAQQKADNFVDMAEAIFGYVDLKIDRPARGGRVFVTNAYHSGTNSDIWHEEISPQVLSSPKPTSIQLYLTQSKPNVAKQLSHYDSDTDTETSLRGYKLYWHKGNRSIGQIEADRERVSRYPKQFTRVRPIRSGVKFEFSIYFENLSDKELGALLWILKFANDERYRLKLGMGKPLGMGSVKIEGSLFLTDRKQRYAGLFGPNGGWVEGLTPSEDIDEKARSEFEQFVLDNPLLNPSRKVQTLEQAPLISVMLALLSWPGPNPKDTEYMTELRQDFAKRKVLPNAMTVAHGGTTARITQPTEPPNRPRPGSPAGQSGPSPQPSRQYLHRTDTPQPSQPQHQGGGKPIKHRSPSSAETGIVPRSKDAPRATPKSPQPELSHPTAPDQVTDGMYLEGTVVGVEPTRVIVDIGVGEDASLPVGKIEPMIRDDFDLDERFPEGKRLRVYVTGRNKKGRIQLSLRRPDRAG